MELICKLRRPRPKLDFKRTLGSASSNALHFSIREYGCLTPSRAGVRYSKGFGDKLMDNLKGNETVMVVDDEEPVRIILSKFLTRLGYNVLTAEDGQIAVEKFAENRETVKAVVMDVQMPRKDGITAFHEIKGINPDTGIFLLSGHHTFENDTPNLPMIRKPFHMLEVAKKIRELLDTNLKS